MVTGNLFAAIAPDEPVVVQYDRIHLALYAAILDAQATGIDLSISAKSLMNLDIEAEDALACWVSHAERANWIVSQGLEDAIRSSIFAGFNK